MSRPTRLRRLAALLVGAACAFPFVYLAALSFVGRWAPDRLLPEAWTAGRWATVFMGGTGLGVSFLTSGAVALAVAAVATAVGFVAARYVAYHRRRRALLFLAYVPFAMSPVLLGVCLLHLYLRAGLGGTAAGVVLAHATLALGFAVVFFTAFWTPRVRAMEDAAFTLGASRRQVYGRVLLPQARGLLVIGFFQTFLLSWFQYGLTLLVGGGKVQTLPVKVFNYLNEASPYYAALAACLIVIPPALLLVVNRRAVFRDVGV